MAGEDPKPAQGNAPLSNRLSGKRTYTVRDELRQFRAIFAIATAVIVAHCALLIIVGARISTWLQPQSDIYLWPTALLLLVGVPVVCVFLLFMLQRTWRYLGRSQRVRMACQPILLIALVAGVLASPGFFRCYPVQPVGFYFGDGAKLQQWALAVLARPQSQTPFPNEPVGDIYAAFANAQRKELGKPLAPADLPKFVWEGPMPNVVYVHRGGPYSYVAILLVQRESTRGFLVGAPTFSIGYARIGYPLWRGVYYLDD